MFDESFLTRILRRSGRLTHGEVTRLEMSTAASPAGMSKLYELELGYSADAQGTFPDECLMKVVEQAAFPLGEAEVAFYRFAATPPAAGQGGRLTGLVESYGSWIDEDERLAVVLLEQRRQQCVQPDWPIPHAMSDCRRAIRTLADVHAAWWGSEAAVRIQSQRPLPQSDPDKLSTRMEGLFDKLGDALSQERRRLIERLVGDYPERHASYVATAGRQTLVHGDPHLWNFLIPVQPDGQVTLIDWQLWGIDLGAADLAYMIALHWFPERRVRFEQNLVWEWVHALTAAGVSVDRETAWQDYRFAVAGLLPRTVVYSAAIPANIWWPHLERAFLAFDDLDCAELLS